MKYKIVGKVAGSNEFSVKKIFSTKEEALLYGRKEVETNMYVIYWEVISV